MSDSTSPESGQPPKPAQDTSHQKGFAAYLLRATAASWLSRLLNIAYAFFITPIIIAALQKDLYGVWSYLNGMLAYSNLLYLGLGSAFIKYLAEYRATGQAERAARLTSTVFMVYGGIGLVCLAIAAGLARWVPDMFGTPIGPAASHQAVIACVLLGFRLLFMFLGTVYAGMLSAAGRVATSQVLGTITVLGRLIAVPLLVNHGPPLVMLAAIVTTTAALKTILLWGASRRILSDIRIRFAKPRKPELKLLYGFGLKSFVLTLSGLLVSQADMIVTGVRISASAVALYAIPVQLVAYGRSLVGGMIGALLPKLAVYEARNDRAGMREAYIRVSRAANYGSAFIAFNLATLGAPFIALWIGQDFAEAGRLCILLLALAGYGRMISSRTTVPFFTAMNSFRAPMQIMSAEALINLGLSIWLAGIWGINGVAAGTLIPVAALSCWLLPRALCKKLEVPGGTYFVTAILPSLFLLLVGLLGNEWVNTVWYPGSYGAIVLRGLANTAFAFVLGIIVLPREDHELFKRLTGTMVGATWQRLRYKQKSPQNPNKHP